MLGDPSWLAWQTLTHPSKPTSNVICSQSPFQTFLTFPGKVHHAMSVSCLALLLHLLDSMHFLCLHVSHWTLNFLRVGTMLDLTLSHQCQRERFLRHPAQFFLPPGLCLCCSSTWKGTPSLCLGNACLCISSHLALTFSWKPSQLPISSHFSAIF